MNLNKNVSVWRGSDTPPTEYHLWVKNELLYIKDENDWKSISTSIKNSIVEQLPEIGDEGVIYYLKNDNSKPNRYTEYVWINKDWEKYGDFSEDLLYCKRWNFDASKYDFTSQVSNNLEDSKNNVLCNSFEKLKEKFAQSLINPINEDSQLPWDLWVTGKVFEGTFFNINGEGLSYFDWYYKAIHGEYDQDPILQVAPPGYTIYTGTEESAIYGCYTENVFLGGQFSWYSEKYAKDKSGPYIECGADGDDYISIKGPLDIKDVRTIESEYGYLRLDSNYGKLSLGVTIYETSKIYANGKSIYLDEIVVASDLEEVENVAANAIKTLASVSGLINSEDKIAYVAPTTSGEFSNTTSVMDMLNHIDSVWANITMKSEIEKLTKKIEELEEQVKTITSN